MHSHDILHILEHSVTDTLVALPFLFLAYLLRYLLFNCHNFYKISQK